MRESSVCTCTVLYIFPLAAVYCTAHARSEKKIYFFTKLPLFHHDHDAMGRTSKFSIVSATVERCVWFSGVSQHAREALRRPWKRTLNQQSLTLHLQDHFHSTKSPLIKRRFRRKLLTEAEAAAAGAVYVIRLVHSHR